MESTISIKHETTTVDQFITMVNKLADELFPRRVEDWGILHGQIKQHLDPYLQNFGMQCSTWRIDYKEYNPIPLFEYTSARMEKDARYKQHNVGKLFGIFIYPHESLKHLATGTMKDYILGREIFLIDQSIDAKIERLAAIKKETDDIIDRIKALKRDRERLLRLYSNQISESTI